MFAASKPRIVLLTLSSACILLCLLVVGCSDGGSDAANITPEGTEIPAATLPVRPPTEHELPIRVATTLPLFEEFAKAAGKENVEVISLIPPGADPHTYELTPEDIQKMAGIDFFFLNGGELDSHLEEVIEANRDEDAFVIPAYPNIRSPQGGGLTAEQAGDNPHLWLDPDLASIYAEIAADEFIIYDGIRNDFYTANFNDYREQALALQSELTMALSVIRPERRKIVTLHDAFDHFARRFDLSVAGFAVSAPADSLSDGEIQRLADLVRTENVAAVFTEYGYDAAPMEAVATRAGVPLCTLYSDILSAETSTYETMMRANAAELIRCLG